MANSNWTKRYGSMRRGVNEANRINFLKADFLVCPECGEDAPIEKAEKTACIAICGKCNIRWKIECGSQEDRNNEN